APPTGALLPPGASAPSSPPSASPPSEEGTEGNSGAGGQIGPNRAPRVAGPVYLRDVTGGAILLIGLMELLRNATDPDGDTMFVVDVNVSSGSLTETEGGWIFQGIGAFTEPVVVTYTITDGALKVPQTAHFTAIRPWIEGGEADDLLVGTIWSDDIIGHAGDDNIDGRAGDDVIAGGDGDDHILGGAGHDTIFGGRGNDIIFGQAGRDHLFGGAGDDQIHGGDGDDLVFGEDGNDLLFGDAGDDLLYGAAGHDQIFGGTGDDQLFGGAGHDVLHGGDGDDKLFGEAGNDLLHDGAGRDEIFGGDGDDHVIAAPDAEDDQFHGGDGFDTLDYSQTTEGVIIDLSAGLATGGQIGADVFTGFEKAIGGDGDDHFIVGPKAAVLVGGEGENTFEFLQETVFESLNLVVHQILDFKYGDSVRLSNFKLFEKVYDKLEDEFEAMYGEDIDEDDIPIRVRHDMFDEVRQTIIEADFDNNETFETTIYIQGHHALVITDMTA
ncbi:MAG: cadherin-like domain-containing protein, partial [Paracoccaceae bacterium]|nr:cadherin-like domain-containing protein [Paracoccaceae bacterium]